MSNRIFFRSTLFIISLLLIQSCQLFTSCPQVCPCGNSDDTTYMWRDENRCEGIIKNIPVNQEMRLISLTTSAITTFDKKLQLRIPRFSDSNDVSVRSLAKRYQLDKIQSFKSEASALTFSWSTYVLTKENIAPESLRVLASYKDGSQVVYVPVTLGKSSGEYKFVLYSDSAVENSTVQISRNGKSVYTSPRKTSQGGEIIFKWKPNKAPKGRYQLKYKVELQQIGKPAKKYERTILFEHNLLGYNSMGKK